MIQTKYRIFFLLSLLFTFTHAHYRYVLTGGPGVGKSTVINLLQKMGYQTVPEAWTLLYDEAKEQNRLQEFSDFCNSAEFRTTLMDVQLSLESAANKDVPAFLDRSTIDTVAFGHFYNIAMPQSMLDVLQQKKYDLVFILDHIPNELYSKAELCSLQDSLKIHEWLQKFYTQLGYLLIAVPFDSPEKRVEFILRQTIMHQNQS